MVVAQKNLKTFKAGDVRHKILSFQDVEVKAASTDADKDIAGEIKGYAAGLLNIDRGQDIIFPGAFTEDIEEFKRDGVVAYQHDYTAIIGKPMIVEEKLAPDYGLYTEAEIVATSLGADVMKLVKRKVLKSLSIGYQLKKGGFTVLNRETLLATLKERGIEQAKQDQILADFDKRKLESVFGLFNIKLYEYSVVTTPMNPEATITGAKNELTGGLLDGLPFSYQPLQVLAAVKGYAERVRESHNLYSEKSRSLSKVHKDGISEVRENLEKLLPELKALESLVSAEKAAPESVNRVLAAYYEIEAKLNGVCLT